MKKQLIILMVAGVVMIGIFYKCQSSAQSKSQTLEDFMTFEEDDLAVIEDEDLEAIAFYLVDVKGQVKYPGVYEVEASLRVHEVIEQAGGFLETANSGAINLAQKIYDEMVIYVPHIDEEETIEQSRLTQASGPSKVSLNRASQAELESLPGIGPAKATAILNYRDEMGNFSSIDEITNVSGIGEKTLEKLRDYLEL